MRQILLSATLVFAAVAAAPAPRAWGQHAVPPPVFSVPQVLPQFNNPGPQILIPPPGNPVEQLSPPLGTPPAIYAAPQIYIVPEERSRDATHRHRRLHPAHRHPARDHGDRRRSGEAPQRSRSR